MKIIKNDLFKKSALFFEIFVIPESPWTQHRAIPAYWGAWASINTGVVTTDESEKM